jgi:hypothetical protein
MGGACSVHGRDEMCVKSWLESVKIRGHLEDVGLDVKIILKWILSSRVGQF